MPNLTPPKLLLIAAFALLTLGGRPPGVLAQQPADEPELPPKVKEFMKPTPVEESDSELRRKQKERHNLAIIWLEERVEAYRKGTRGLTSVLDAARMVSTAKLDLARNRDERRQALEQILAVAQLVEARIKDRIKTGLASKDDLERAVYDRLSVEIEILQLSGDDKKDNTDR